MAANDVSLFVRIKAIIEGAGSIRDVANELRTFSEEAKKVPEGLNQGVDASDRLGASFDRLLKAIKFVSGGFLALQGVSLVKGLADTAARTETLGVVLDVVGRNAGYTAVELNKASKDVQALGITAAAARQSLTQLIQANIPLSFSQGLARAAQDLAVITGQNSSETFQRLIVNIQQLDTTGLRFMGLVIDREKAFADAKRASGKEVEESAKKQVFANAVLTEAAKLQGIYEASLNSSGKLLQSLPRYVENFKVQLGDLLLPTYLELIKASIAAMKVVGEFATALRGAGKESELFGTQLDTSGGLLSGFADAVESVAKVVSENKEAVREFATVLKAIAVGLAVGTGLNLFVSGLAALAALVPTVATALGALTASVIAAGGAFAIVGGGLTGVAAAVATLLGPVGLVVAGVTALGAVVYGGYKAWQAWGDSAEEASTKASNTASNVEELIKLYKRESDTIIQRNILLQKKLELDTKAAQANTFEEKKGFSDQAKAIQEQIDALNKLSKADSKRKEDLQKQIDSATDLTKVQKEAIFTAQKAAADNQKAVQAQQEALNNYRNALQAAGIDFGSFSTGVSTKFSQSTQAIDAGLKLIASGAVDSKDGVRALIDELIELASKASNTTELEALAKSLGKVREAVSGGELRRESRFAVGFDAGTVAQLDKIEAQAKRNVEKKERERKAGGSAALAEQKAYAAALAAAERKAVDSSIAIAKAGRDLESQQNSQAYDQSLISFSDYYDKRLDILKRAGEDELRAQDANIKEARAKLAQADTGAAKKSAQSELDAAIAKRVEISTRNTIALQKELFDRKQAAKKLDEEIVQLELDNRVARNQDDLAAKIELVNRKRDQAIERMKAMNALSGQELDPRALKALNDQARIEIESLQRGQRQVEFDRQKAAAANEEAEARARVNLEVANGLKTQKEADSEIAKIEADKLARLGREIDFLEREKKLVQDQPALVADLDVKLSAARQAVIQVQQELAALSKENKFFQGLTDQFDDFISGLLNGTKTIKQAFKDLFTGIFRQVNQSLSRDLAEGITKSIRGSLSQAGQSGSGGPSGFLDGLVKSLFPAPGSISTVPNQVGPPQQPQELQLTTTNFTSSLTSTLSSALTGIGDAFNGFIGGAGSLFSGVLGAMQPLFRGLLDGLNSIFSSISSSSSSSGGFFSGIGSFFSSLFGGGRAAGGSVSAGMLYRVNESRPEVLSIGSRDYLMMGNRDGYVNASPKMGGRSVTNVINVSVPRETGRSSADQVAASVAERLQIIGSRNN